ncbi:MAG: hypothetical protein KGI80_00145 [Verrucomicrobiota bacterium]|nr:hypothetical protein [Verrucomicrobiota bacterium]
MKKFILFAMATAFFISFEYAATRPSSSAIFLTTFSSESIPWVWLVSVPCNFACVFFYNRFLAKLGPLRMFAAVASIICAVHLFSALALPYAPWFIFFQFLWKDIYILLVYKQFWSMIHTTVSSDRAKFLYGLFMGVGTCGAIVGSLLPSFFAVEVGSATIFLSTLPVYFLLFFLYRSAFTSSALQRTEVKSDLSVEKSTVALIRSSPLLLVALSVVAFMQVSIGIMDYLFNVSLEQNISNLDLRTAYVGKITGLTNLVAGIFQFLGGFLMVHFLGVRGGHLFVPLFLLGNACLAFFLPSFAMLSFSYILIKSVDFSLFGIVREMLYIPMKVEEKFRAKAFIDVFVWRSIKALIGLCILFLQFFLSDWLLPSLHYLAFLLFFLWITAVYFLLWKRNPLATIRSS